MSNFSAFLEDLVLIDQIENLDEWEVVDRLQWYEVHNWSGIWVSYTELSIEWNDVFPDTICRWEEGITEVLREDEYPSEDAVREVSRVLHRHDEQGYLYHA